MKGFIVALFLLLALPMSALAQDGVKFGSFDIQKVLAMSDAGRAAKEQLAQREGKLEAEQIKKETELKELKIALESQTTLLNETARSDKERTYQRRFREYQHFKKKSYEELQARSDEFGSQIMEDIVKVAQEYGRTHGFTAIFIKNETLVYLDTKADLSEEVLKAFNESTKKP